MFVNKDTSIELQLVMFSVVLTLKTKFVIDELAFYRSNPTKLQAPCGPEEVGLKFTLL